MCSSMNAVRRFCRSLTRGEYSKSIVLLLCSAFQNSFDLRPAQLAEGPRARPRFAGMLARRGAVDDTLGDALADRGEAEQVVGHVVVPDRRLDTLAAGALEIQ